MPLRSLTKILASIVVALLLLPRLALALPGDLNGSGRVDGYDLINFGRANGSVSGDANWNPEADLDGSGVVDSADLDILSAQFGRNGVSFGLWAANTGTAYKLSEKGNLLKTLAGFSSAQYVAAGMPDGNVWVSDYNSSKLVLLDGFSGAILKTINGVKAYGLSVNHKDGSLWVADSYNNRVIKILSGVPDNYTIGTHTGSHIVVSGFNQPRSISVDPDGGVAWVADTYNDRVVRLNMNVADGYNVASGTGSHSIKTGFNDPYCVSANLADGTVWVADYYNNAVVKLSALGATELVRVGGFASPRALQANYVDGTVWVADYSNNRVVRLGGDGSLLCKSGNLNQPLAVAVNPLDGSCWIAYYASTDSLVHLSPSGAELKRVSGVSYPTALALTPNEASLLRYPAASAQVSKTMVDVGEILTFTGMGADPDGQIVKYEWDLNGDGVFDFSSASTGATTGSYPAAGIYNPVFRVTDNDFLTASDYSQVVRVGALTAQAGANVVSGTAPLAVSFTGTFVDPVDGRVSSYQWDFDGDAVFDNYSETTGNINYTYAKAGTYWATFKVTDGAFYATDSIQITVAKSPPTANATATPASGNRPLTVALNGTATDSDGSVLLYQWDFDGDGTYDWSSTVNGQASYVYADAGAYAPRFRATDNDGLTATKSLSVLVSLVPPTAVITSTLTSAHAPTTVAFDAGSSFDADGNIVSYEWNFEGELGGVITCFSDDMESGSSQWTAAESPWALTTEDAHSGTTCWTDSPGGDYTVNVNAAIYLPPIDISTAATATVSFWHRYNTESCCDFGQVQVSTNDGASWSSVANFSGLLSAWTQYRCNLDSYAGTDDLRIRFLFRSDGSVQRDGWYIDDVAVDYRETAWTATPGPTASHQYTQAGAYTARLRVTDNDGMQTIATRDVTMLPDGTPLASASADVVSGMAGMTVNFSGSGDVPGGSIVNYSWTFGEEYVWVADKSHDQAVRVFQDGSGEAARVSGFNDPQSVAVDPNDGTVWVADYYNHALVKLSADGRQELLRIAGINYPIWVDVDPADGSVWAVTMNSPTKLLKYSSTGNKLVERSGLFSNPPCVAVNELNGSVWVADSSNHRIVEFDVNGVQTRVVTGFNYPWGVEVDPNNGTIWVSDYYGQQVIRFSSTVPNNYNIGTDTGSHTVASGFYYPKGLAVDPVDGTLWVADRNNSKVVHLAADGASELARLSGFYYPEYVAVNPVTRDVWVSNTNNHQVVKLSKDGTELARLGGFYYPAGISVQQAAGNQYNSASSAAVSHQYTHPGAYRAILTVTDDTGDTASAYVDIVVRAAPVVTATAQVTSGPAPLEVYFFAQTSDLDGKPVLYEWDYDGDGTYDYRSSASPDARHIYTNGGTYNATIRVTDIDGNTDTDSITITAANAPPVVSASAAPLAGNAPLTVNFNGTGSDPDGSIVKYEWDFTSDATYDYESADSAQTSHVYNSGGVFTATLRVTDDDGLTGADTVVITVTPAGAPLALVNNLPSRGNSPLDVCFYLHGLDSDGVLTNYEMDWEGDGVYDASWASPPTAFGDSMELGQAYWTAEGAWARTTSQAHSGSYCWTDSPGGNYAAGTNASLTSSTIDLSGATAPKLVFWHKYNTAGGDYTWVEVSGNNGSTWTLLAQIGNNVSLGAWTRMSYDLAAYKGNATVKVRFRFTSDATDTPGDGWYVDDVWVGDCVSHTYNTHGAYQPTLRVTDNSANQSTASQPVAVLSPDDATYIWVTDYSNNLVKKLAEDGTVLSTIYGFNRPYDAEADPATGNIWVSDRYNNRVIRLESDVPDKYDVNAKYMNDASPTDSVSKAAGDGIALVTGKFSQGLNFDGNWDYVQIPYNAAFDTQSFTVEAWFKSTSVSGRTIFMRSNNSGGNELYFGCTGTTNFSVYLNDSSRTFTGSTNLQDGTFHHVALVHDADANTLTLYLDGAVYGTPISIDTTLDWGLSDMLIGADFDTFNGGISDFWLGVIDDVRFWNVARSQAQIQASKDTALNGNEPGLVSYWTMETLDTPYHLTVTGMKEPLRMGIDTLDSSIWIADYQNHRAVKLAADGTRQALVVGVNAPQAVDVDPVHRRLWIADTENDRVISMTADFQGTVFAGSIGTMADSTANANHAWLAGNAAPATGQLSGGLAVDASYDYAEIPWDTPVSIQSFTVEAWAKSTYVNGRAIFDMSNSANGDELYFGCSNSTTIQAIVNDVSKTFAGSVNLADGAFHHYALVFNAGASTLACYVDGVQYGSVESVSGPLDFGESRALIGAAFYDYNRSLGRFWGGTLDDVRLWNVVRTGTEIANNRNAPLVGNEAGLIGYWKLDALTAYNGATYYTGIDGPVDVTADVLDGGAWASLYNGNQVVKLVPGGNTLRRLDGFLNPAAVAMNPNNGSVWVADFSNDQMVKLSHDEAELLRIGGHDNPHDVEINPHDNTAWMVNHYGHQVVRLAADGTELLRVGGFYYPTCLTISTTAKETNNPPVATASADKTSGDAPLTVAFTGSGADDGSVVLYEWDFDGDGVFDYSSSSGNTSYTYTTPDIYNPVLRVTDNDGMTGYDSSLSIHVGPAKVLILPAPSSGNAPLTVKFRVEVLGMPAGARVVQYDWDYDDDGVYDATGSYPAKVFTTGGAKLVTCRVTDTSGNYYYGNTTVNVAKTPPTAYNYASPTSGNVPLTVYLNGASTDADGSVVRYEWDYDGDGVYDWTSTTESKTYFTYTTAGVYNATIRVTDNDGLKTAVAKTITVNDVQLAPIANGSADKVEGNAPLTVNFTGTGNDPDEGNIVAYEWDFDGDGVYDFSSANNGNTSHAYPQVGVYKAVLRLTDGDGLTGTDNVVITVKAAGMPTAVANAVPTQGDTPLNVVFDADGSTDPDGSLTKYEWFFGSPKIWVADYNVNKVKQVDDFAISKDLGGFLQPHWISVDPNDGTAWVADLNHHQVVKLLADGSGEIVRVGGFARPHGVAVTPSDSTVWVTDTDHDQVVKLSPTGAELLRVGGFDFPYGIDIKESDGSVWISDHLHHQVVKLDSAGNELVRVSGFWYPAWVTLDQKDGSVWVADRDHDQIVKLAPDVPNGYSRWVTYLPDSSPSVLLGQVYGNMANAEGNINGGAFMDGSYDYVRIAPKAAMDVQNFTIEAWVKPTSVNGRAIFTRGNSAGQNELMFGILDQDSLFAVLDNGANITFDGSANFLDGSFHHVALTHDADSDELKAYVDGVQYGATQSVAVTLDFGGVEARIGSNQAINNNFFHGVVDDLRLWNVARTQGQIAGAKDAGLAGSETGLVGYWNCNALSTNWFHTALGGFDNPQHIAVNPEDHTAWVADYYRDAIVHVNADCTLELGRYTGFDGPHAVYLEPGGATIWAAINNANQIVALNPDGTRRATIGGVVNPTCVAGAKDVTSYFSSTQNGDASRVYPLTGEYEATLRVTDNNGNTDSDTVHIRAGAFPEARPIAYPTTGTAPLTVYFGSNGYSPTGTIETFDWDFNGDGVQDLHPTDWDRFRPANLQYTYRLPGTYIAAHTVTDNRGLTGTAYVTITVLPPEDGGAPQAIAVATPAEGNAPLAVTLQGFGKDADGFIRKYEWDYTSDGVYDFTSVLDGATAHTYGSEGEYTATLRVTDDKDLTGAATVDISVKPVGAPTAQASASPVSGNASLTVAFTGSGTDNGGIVKYEWDFEGDGSWDYTSASTASTSHIYTLPGDYYAVLRVTDNDGLTDTAKVNVQVSAGITASLSNDQFDPAIATTSINSVLTCEARITVKISDRFGTLVRTLVSNALRTAGHYSDVWNGRDNSGDVVPSGVYLYIIEYVVGGKTYYYDMTTNVTTALQYPATTYPANFSPFSADTNFFRYTLAQKAEVTFYMSEWDDYSLAGRRVKTLALRKPQKAGSYVMVWDGTDDQGNLVPVGAYLIATFAWYLPPNAIIVNNRPVLADVGVTPAYLNPDALPYDDVNAATFGFTLSKTADVTANIYDSGNYIVKSVTLNDVTGGVQSEIQWDGRNANGDYVTPGVYRVKLMATDAAGNTSEDANGLLIVFY